MHSTKIVSIAVAAGVLEAWLTIAPVDADPVNRWGAVRGGPHSAWRPNRDAWHSNPLAWHRNHGRTYFLYGSPYGDYWPPYGDYWPPYAGSGCVGSTQWRNAFCY
jgi:hypothetical protein